MKLYTIGFKKRSAKNFFTVLKDANVQKLIDVRRKNNSLFSGFTKKQNLQFFLEECFAIVYEHIPEFAPSEEILKSYKKELGSKKYNLNAWDDYVRQFNSVVLSKLIVGKFKNAVENFSSVCLLCSEEKADYCHRRLLAEYFEQQLPNIKIIHL